MIDFNWLLIWIHFQSSKDKLWTDFQFFENEKRIITKFKVTVCGKSEHYFKKIKQTTSNQIWKIVEKTKRGNRNYWKKLRRKNTSKTREFSTQIQIHSNIHWLSFDVETISGV